MCSSSSVGKSRNNNNAENKSCGLYYCDSYNIRPRKAYSIVNRLVGKIMSSFPVSIFLLPIPSFDMILHGSEERRKGEKKMISIVYNIQTHDPTHAKKSGNLLGKIKMSLPEGTSTSSR